MQLGKKISALTFIWLFMAATVVLVWFFRERREQLTIWLVPIDHNLVQGGWDNLSNRLDTLALAGILLEMDTHSIHNHLSTGTGDDLLRKLKNKYPNKLFNIAPDSLHLKAMHNSRLKALDKLDEAAYRNYQTFEMELPRWRTRALLERGAMRDSLLTHIQNNRLALTGDMLPKLQQRYSQLMLRKATLVMQQNADSLWLMLVDIEQYAPLKAQLAKKDYLQLYEP